MLTAAVSLHRQDRTAVSEACSGPFWACSTAQSGGLVSVGDGGGTDSVCGLVSGPNVRVSCIKYPLDCAHSRIFATL